MLDTVAYFMQIAYVVPVFIIFRITFNWQSNNEQCATAVEAGP